MIEHLSQVLVNLELDSLPTTEKVGKSLKQMSIRETSGSDTISAELYKAGGSVLLHQITHLFWSLWAKEQLLVKFLSYRTIMRL